VTAGRGKRRFLILLCCFGLLLFSALGAWQVERRAWKLDLITRIDARVHAAPVAVPSRAEWARINAPDDEYRRVRLAGRFLDDRETLVEALTERGAGFWVLTPLQTGDGTILVNRGFVPPERKSSASRSSGRWPGPVEVVGLLRMTEPKGRFLRPNRPEQERWYSRDVIAIAKARGLSNVAPFFIDADAKPNPGGYPIGGMTMVAFRNMHLVYALTWFGLAGLCLAGLVLLFRREP
jgi:surfeit locus 1 family protein